MHKIKVLLVEDEPIIAEDLRRQLTKHGYHIVGMAETGREAIDLVSAHAPDVILMDIRIEGDMDGIETAYQIHQHHDVPVIFITSNTDPSTFARAKLTKPHAFLSKPFRTSDIVNSIQLALFSKTSEEVDQQVRIADDAIFLRDKTGLVKLAISDILFVQADGAYAIIHARSREYTSSLTLKKFLEEVPHARLLRVHRSYAVNVQMVDRISESTLHIGQHVIPISKAHREEVMKLFPIV
ncbi:MAG: response regulator [Bacteroidota bacterium]